MIVCFTILGTLIIIIIIVVYIFKRKKKKVILYQNIADIIFGTIEENNERMLTDIDKYFKLLNN